MSARIVAALLSMACVSAAAAAQEPYTITTTTGMITDIVRQVAGDRARVQGIMKEGVDPHLYKPTRNDVVMLMEADVVFYNGLLLEGKMVDILDRVARRNPHVYAVTDALKAAGYVMAGPHGHPDPHVWMDVGGWMEAVKAVSRDLGEYDPEYRDRYAANADAYLKQLEALQAYAKKSIASVPAQQRVLVTAHDAFSYLGRACGLQVRGIQGISTESEAGVKDINDLVRFLADGHIRAVFVETSVADKNVRALVEGANALGHKVIIGGKLFSDAMGQAGTYEGTYIGMIDHNVTTITRALGGEAPASGMQGKLQTDAH